MNEPNPDHFTNHNLSDSIPLLPEIRGGKDYKNRLTKTATETYEMLSQQSDWPLRVGKDAIIEALKFILHSVAHIGSHPLITVGGRIVRQESIAVPLNRNEFTDREKYGHLSYTAFKAAVHALSTYVPAGERESLVSLYSAHFNPQTGQRWRSRIGPSRNLLDRLTQSGLIFAHHPTGRRPATSRSEESLLWLSKGNDDPHTDAGKSVVPIQRPLQGDETILPELNRRLGAQRLSCPLPDYHTWESHYDYRMGYSKLFLTGQKRLYRQFSEQDGRAGRLYGHFVQGIPSDLRKHLTINRSPTVELDYGSMQLVLLYAMSGVAVPDGDLYAISANPDDRELMKMVLTMSVGNGTKEATVGAIKNWLQRQNRRCGWTKARQLYDNFWAVHWQVCPHSPSSDAMWSTLQHADSNIALRVLRYLLEEEITAIAIHDSFIVKLQHHDELRGAMLRAFRDFHPGTRPVIR